MTFKKKNRSLSNISNHGSSLVVRLPQLDKKAKLSEEFEINVKLLDYKNEKLKSIIENFGWNICQPLVSDWDLLWCENPIMDQSLFHTLKIQQKINQFPGIKNLISSEGLLAKSLRKMNKMFPNDYNIYPQTWVYPTM